tara:strand:+ start:488 stop:1255 length:768 start_codon:yes stop_codon:yes gene_type:complete
MSQWNGREAKEWIDEVAPKDGLFRAYWGLETLHDPTTEGTPDCCERGKCGRAATLDREKSTGQLRWEWTYKNGKVDGISKGYFRTGALKHIRHYKDGIQHGPVKEYPYCDKHKEEPLQFDTYQHDVFLDHFQPWVDGKLEGIEYWMFTWPPTGCACQHIGTQNDNDQTGLRCWERTWKNNKLNGSSISWYSNGQVRQETEYKDNFEHGTRISWSPDGKKIMEANYNMGRILSAKRYGVKRVTMGEWHVAPRMRHG